MNQRQQRSSPVFAATMPLRLLLLFLHVSMSYESASGTPNQATAGSVQHTHAHAPRMLHSMGLLPLPSTVYTCLCLALRKSAHRPPRLTHSIAISPPPCHLISTYTLQLDSQAP